MSHNTAAVIHHHINVPPTLVSFFMVLIPWWKRSPCSSVIAPKCFGSNPNDHKESVLSHSCHSQAFEMLKASS